MTVELTLSRDVFTVNLTCVREEKNIHTTVQTTIQHEIIDTKTPFQDLQLKGFMNNNPYSVERVRLILI